MNFHTLVRQDPLLPRIEAMRQMIVEMDERLRKDPGNPGLEDLRARYFESLLRLIRRRGKHPYITLGFPAKFLPVVPLIKVEGRFEPARVARFHHFELEAPLEEVATFPLRDGTSVAGFRVDYSTLHPVVALGQAQVIALISEGARRRKKLFRPTAKLVIG